MCFYFVSAFPPIRLCVCACACVRASVCMSSTDMERMGATASREAIRMPISQIPPVSSRAQVGSPLAFPWPNTWNTHTHTHRWSGLTCKQKVAGSIPAPRVVEVSLSKAPRPNCS